mgnify:CR=1 FL=1
MSHEYKKIINKIDSFNHTLKIQSNLNCIVSDLSAQAQNELDSFDDKQKDGKLYGKTIAIKDNINIKGVLSSCSSRMLKNYISPYSATVVERIKKEGGIILGTTNMDEFAMGSSTEHSVYGPTINSYGDNLVPGGSSGGSAVSVSSKMVDLALGSDTGGSVRQPASFCGVYGLKPTYGRISRYGLTAFASSFDQIGIFSRNINDMADLFYAISGYDKYDSTSSNKDVEVFKYSENKVRKMKIGMPYKLDSFDYVNSEVLDSYYKMIDFLKSEGFDLVELDMKNLKYSVPTYYVLTTAEASSNLARFDGVRYGLNVKGVDIDSNYCNTKTKGFGDEVKRRVIIGTYVLSSGYYDAFYSKAQKVRTIIKSDFDKAFNSVDLLFLPTSPELPYRLGDKMEDPLSMYMADIFTVPMNLSGIPAISVPADLSRKGLPIGMQFAANNFEENNLFSICKFLSDNNKIIN